MFRSTVLTLIAAAVVATPLAVVGSAAPATNGRIVFEREMRPGDDASTQLFVMSRNGTGESQLTRSKGGALGPAPVPNSSTFAFSAHPAGTTECLYWKVNPVSPNTSRIRTVCGAQCLAEFAPAVSPDGTKIAFVAAYGPMKRDAADHVQLLVANSDGSDRRVLRSSSWLRDRREPGPYAPTWSPDGNRLAFADVYRSGRSVLYAINVGGTGLRRLTQPSDASGPRGPAWSPAGDVIAFNTRNGYLGRPPEIYTIRPNGTGRTRLTSSVGRTGAWAPAWSADGKQIVFVRWDPEWGQSDLWVMSADGTSQKHVKRTREDESKPAWLGG